jgi:membrane AbrB-like protein
MDQTLLHDGWPGVYASLPVNGTCLGASAEKQMAKLAQPLKLLFTLCLGALGAAAAVLVGVPLPYLLGPLFVVIPAALLRAPVIRPPDWIVTPMRVVLGVMVGASLTPDLFLSIGALGISIMAVPVFVIVSGALGYIIYRKAGGYSPPEAYFAALPGGLHTMTAYAEDMGIDVHRIALAQALRVVLVVAGVPLILWGLRAEVDVGGAAYVVPMMDVSVSQHLSMLAAGIAGYLLGRVSRIPGGSIIGPMIVSSALHLGGVIDSPASFELLALAQIVLGCAIGARFVGESIGLLRAGLHLAILGIIASAAVTLLLAWPVSALTGRDILSVALALAPGGMPEMSLMAIALGLEAAFVVVMHLVRILFVLLAAPMVWGFLRARGK